jgi:tetratricopeptide (TPR) repeat protein
MRICARVGRALGALGLALGIATGPTPAPAAPAPAAADTAPRSPSLLVPAVPDSAPPESPPGPLLIPGRTSAATDSAFPSARKRARDAYQQGRALEAAGSGGPAIISYRTALRLDPSLPDASYRMAMLFLTRNQVDEAVKCLVTELKHHPENVDASRELGLCFARFGDYPRATDHLQGLARAYPKDGSVWHALGSVHLAAGRPADAEKALGKALRLGANNAETLRDMGATMAAQGRESDARVYYRRAVSLDPGDAASWLNLGNLERRAGRPDSALALYRRAEAADSGFTPALDAQIQVLSQAKRDVEVLDAYRRHLKRHPDHHAARLEAIHMLEAQDREAEALALALEGVEGVPNDGQSYLILGMVLRGQGNPHGAMTALYKAQRLFAGKPAERERVTGIINGIRASSPESVRAGFPADSLASLPRRRR